MEDSKVMIEASRIGLPETATAKEIRDGVYALAMERDSLKREVELWRGRAEETQALLIEAKKDVSAKKEMEGRLVVKAAIDARKIFPKDEAFYLELYKKDAEFCKKRLDELVEQRWQERQDSLRGDIGDPPNDPEIELSVAVAGIMANNQKLTEAQAVLQAYKVTPGLQKRVLEARREKKDAKGGVR